MSGLLGSGRFGSPSLDFRSRVCYGYAMSTPIISINFTHEDVRAIADAEGVDVATAIERAEEWGRYIEETASTLCGEQLFSAITTGGV